MRTISGVLVLIFGLVLLAMWGRADHAKRIEADITSHATDIIQNTTHPVKISVSGRDIKASGLADSIEEKENILSRLNNISGRRIILERLMVLRLASPYLFNADYKNGNLSIDGNLPTQIVVEEFANQFNDGNSTQLKLAAGMPNPNWTGFMKTAVSSLQQTQNGNLEVKDMALHFNAVVQNKVEEQTIISQLAKLGNDFEMVIKLEVLDDGLPANLLFNYDEISKPKVSGKFPQGFDAQSLGKILQVENIESAANPSDKPGKDSMSSHFSAIGGWLEYFESLTVKSNAEHVELNGILVKGADLELVEAALSKEIGSSHKLAIKDTNQNPADDEQRINQLSGEKEIASNGYWLPLYEFESNLENCNNSTKKAIIRSNVNFLSGSARLDAQASAIINRLSGILLNCLKNSALSLEIGGHTDSQGNDQANLELSIQRANSVLNSIKERGIGAEQVSAKGFGEQEPIADNNTEAGRAKNRRTAFSWK